MMPSSSAFGEQCGLLAGPRPRRAREVCDHAAHEHGEQREPAHPRDSTGEALHRGGDQQAAHGAAVGRDQDRHEHIGGIFPPSWARKVKIEIGSTSRTMR